MQWYKLADVLPNKEEYAVLLFPCKSSIGILYTASNTPYAIKHGLSSGYTHWAYIKEAPGHGDMITWQDSITVGEEQESLKDSIKLLKSL